MAVGFFQDAFTAVCKLDRGDDAEPDRFVPVLVARDFCRLGIQYRHDVFAQFLAIGFFLVWAKATDDPYCDWRAEQVTDGNWLVKISVAVLAAPNALHALPNSPTAVRCVLPSVLAGSFAFESLVGDRFSSSTTILGPLFLSCA